MGLGTKAGTVDGHLHTLFCRAWGANNRGSPPSAPSSATSQMSSGPRRANTGEADDWQKARTTRRRRSFSTSPCILLMTAGRRWVLVGGEGQVALTTSVVFFGTRPGRSGPRAARQRQTTVPVPTVQIVQQLFQLAVVRGGQAGKAQFFIAGVSAQLLRRSRSEGPRHAGAWDGTESLPDRNG